MKTKIEWVRNEDGTQGYTINPVKGLCPMACSYCYARRMYKRFKWNPEIRFDKQVPIYGFLSGSKVFVGSTIELFGNWINDEWMKRIFAEVKSSPDVTFIFLTKQPQNLIKWSPFPDNCWVGVSATNEEMLDSAVLAFMNIQANIKFISFEPLLEHIRLEVMDLIKIDWVIIGQQTPVKESTTPKIEWIQEIVEACDKASVPVFEKNNLKDFIYGEYGGKYKELFKYTQDGGRELRQEFPK